MYHSQTLSNLIHIFHHLDVKKDLFLWKAKPYPPVYLYLLMSVFGVTLIVPKEKYYEWYNLDLFYKQCKCLLFFCDRHLHFALKLYFF